MKGFCIVLTLALLNTVTNGQNLNCNFDNDNICSWTQVKSTDNADWILNKGPTPSQYTGPPNDHTTNSSTGYYIYYEASDGQTNDKAQLQSPPITVGNAATCLSFWYYMYGPSVNALNVYLMTGTNSLGPAVFHRERTQGEQWNQATITISNVTNAKVVIEAVRGRYYLSDIGVDDILYTNGACGQTGSVTPAPGQAGTITCNFESQDLCGYVQTRSDDNFDWTWATGSSPTPNTGPTNDHTQQSAGGHYMLMESDGPLPNQKCRLTSPLAVSRTPMCLQFYYYMYGRDVRTLNVYVKINNSVGAPLWTRTGNQGATWQVGQATLNTNNQNFHIVFEAIHGNSNLGDIAFDDVTVHTGACAPPGSCDFEKGFCTWTNAIGDDFDWIVRQGTTGTAGTGPTADHTTGTAQVTPPKAVPTSTTMGASTVTTTSKTMITTAHVKTNTVTCTFDYDLCGWTQLTDDQFDWTRQKGGTILPGTGPTGDHTSGTGYYIYTAASVLVANKTGRIQSPQITAVISRPQCLTFWYHMYGPNIGQLNLYVKTRPTLGSPLWTRLGDQGNQWTHSFVALPTTGTYSLVFEAVNGYGFRGDMALDDVSMQYCAGLSTPRPGVTVTPATGNLAARKCTFEQAGNCGYTQDRSDNFDWTRDSAGTVTANTGPSQDHTYGTARGYYMYIETSAPRRTGDKARLISPSYVDNTDICVQFWYHMYGDGVGTLSVYAKVGSTLGLPVFTISGNQGNRWTIGSASVPQSTASRGYQVVFEGVRGTNDRGDIAIDDVSFSAGSCGNPGDCDFDSDLCTWRNVQGTGDSFDWTQGSGNTATGTTGPTNDHTQQNAQGKYMFIETSSPRRPGEVAWLVSQAFPQNPSGGCVSFWYNMYGQTVATLNVYVVPSGSSNRTLWTLSGNRGQQWNQGQAPIPGLGKSFTIIFEGKRGTSDTGDIAIDDITFTTSNCGVLPPAAVPAVQTTAGSTLPTSTATPGQANCNFDTDFCGWRQDRTDNFDWTRQRGPTSSAGTGPPADHSGSGYYIYIETSAQQPNAKARLISPQISPNQLGQKCFTFWYHMYGQHVNRLNVYVQFGLSLPASPTWTQVGTQGNQWKQASLSFAASKPFNLVLEALKGNGYQGDIAVDDVSIADGRCTVCGFLLRSPQYGTVHYYSGSHYGSRAIYSCDSGYELQGNAERTCQETGFWNGTDPTCVQKGCNAPPYIANGRFSVSSTSVNLFAYLRCDPGYIVAGVDHIQCLVGGSWTLPSGNCTPKGCNAPPYIANGRFNVSSGMSVNSFAYLRCNTGYVVAGVDHIRCLAGGSWTVPSGNCTPRDCGKWEYIDGSFANFSDITYTQNTTYRSNAVLRCKHGYRLFNSTEKIITTVCQANATWSIQSPPLCVVVDCGNWEYLNSSRESFSKIEFSKDTIYGSIATSTCIEGYQVINSTQKTLTSVCQANGTWSVKSLPLCTEVDCGKWVFHDSTWAKYSLIQYINSTRFRSTASATCIEGYHLINSTKNSLISTCQANGTWSIESPPLCVEVECPSLKISNDVSVAFNPPNSSFSVNTTAVFTCPNGYNILGVSKIACQPNGAWTALPPTCFKVPGRDKACPFDVDSRGTHWNKSDAGLITFMECPKNYSGQVTRQCSTTGEWMLPIYNCITAEVANVGKSLESLLEHPEKAAMVVDDALEKLKDITQPVQDAGLYDGEVDKIASILDRIASISENMVVSDNQSQNFLDTASNLLDPSTSNTWKSIDQTDEQKEENQDKSGAERVLNTVSKFSDAITKTLNASDVENKTVLTSNLVVHVSKIQKDKDMTMFPESQDKYNISSNLILYKDSLKGMSHYTSVIYKNLSGILSARSVANGRNNTKTAITSSVISVKVDNWERNKDDFKIDLYLGLFEGANGEPQCSFWNDSKSGWDNDGCILLTANVSVTVCRCYHLTNFAILMSPWKEVNEDSKAIDIISIAGCSISLVALVLTVISHVALWGYLKSDRVVILMHLSISLVISYAVFLGGVDRTENKDACTAIAALLHYIYLVVFFLMLAEGIEIAVTVLYVFMTKSRLKWLLPASWLVPAVIVGISLGARQLRGYGNEKFCWLSIDGGLIWAFVVPALTIIIVNVVLLVLVIKTAFTTTISSQKTSAEKVKTGIRCLCVLMPIMGCTWVIGVFYVNSSSAWIQYVFAICNGLQGLVIFICHCVLNKQVQTAIEKRRKKYRDSQMSSNSTSLSKQQERYVYRKLPQSDNANFPLTTKDEDGQKSFRKMSRMSVTSELGDEIPGKFGIVDDRNKANFQSSTGNLETTES